MKTKTNTVFDLDSEPSLTTVQLGVWRLSMLEEPPFNFRKQWNDLFSAVPLLKRLSMEIYRIEPLLFFLFVVSKIWAGVESAVLLFLSSRLLKIVCAIFC